MRGRHSSLGCAPRHAGEEVFPLSPRACVVVALASTLVLFALVATARAQFVPLVPEDAIAEAAPLDPTPKLLYRTGSAMPRIYGTSHRLAPGWKASYGVGLADETSLSSAFLRLDELIESGELNMRGAREKWRHFLGLEYTPLAGLDVLGGISKSSGVNGKDGGYAPTGYDRLRLNSGLRWRGDDWGLEGWGIDSAFSFIPNGPNRWPRETGTLPGMGGAGPTWLMSLTISRTF